MKPPFFPGTAPEIWLRTPRTAHTPAEYACAVEIHNPLPPIKPIFRAVAVVAALAILIPLALHLALR
jgi:hypothetical protein